jgi:predicted membrane-bound spermidine synthase
MLGLFLGVDVFAVTVVVAAFMVGLGAGNGVGGYIADRVRPTLLIPLFAVTELIVAVFGLLSKSLFYNWLPNSFANTGDNALSLLVPSLLLILPTFCMGLTLPLLSKALVTDPASAGAKIGLLYGVNTLGASAGAIVTTVVLMRFFGIPKSLTIAALLNVVSVLGCFVIVARRPKMETETPQNLTEQHEPDSSKIGGFLAIYCLSGFTALALELIWFRLLGVMLKSNSFTFSWLLCLYLAGVGGGTIIGTAMVRKSKQPFLTFLGLQSGVGLYSGLSLYSLLQLIEHAPLFAAAKEYLGTYEPINCLSMTNLNPAFIQLYLCAAALLILPPTLMMGMSFPYLQKSVQTDVVHLGRRIGWLQVANITGATIGTVAIGIFSLGTIGTSASLKLVVLIAGLFVLLWWHVRSQQQAQVARLIGLTASVAVIALTVALIPSHDELWAKLHGTQPQLIIAKESAAGLAVLTCASANFEGPVSVFVNGIGQSYLPFGNPLIHTQLGMLPVFLHPNPVKVGIIGLGSGDTVFGAAGRKDIEQIDCIEIISSEMAALKEYQTRQSYAPLDSILKDPRVNYQFTDGRKFIAEKGRMYDVLEADALRPSSAYSNNIYSTEYFTLLKKHLKPHGLAITWAPTERIYQTFIRVFPHCKEFGPVLVGSNEPLKIDDELVKQRVSDTFSVAHYGNASINGLECLNQILKQARTAPSQYHPLVDYKTNSDLFPRDELGTPQ